MRRVCVNTQEVGAVNTLASGKGKGHPFRVMGVLGAVEHIFNDTAMHARAQASNRANRASHGVPKAHTRVRHRKTGLSGIENSKSEASSDTQESEKTCPIDNSWVHDGWCPMNGTVTGVF